VWVVGGDFRWELPRMANGVWNERPRVGIRRLVLARMTKDIGLR
jgi:hypothetical protein